MITLVEHLVLRTIGLVIGGVLLLRTTTQKFRSKVNTILWYSVSSLLILIATFPRFLDYLGIYLVFTRDLDFLFVFSIFGLYFLVFKLFQQNEATNRAITELVREVALKFKEKKEDQEEGV